MLRAGSLADPFADYDGVGPPPRHTLRFDQNIVSGLPGIMTYPIMGLLTWDHRDFFHQLHHRFSECNYGKSKVPLDQLTGGFHVGARAATKSIVRA